jgi:hypothetical protein
MTMPAAWKLVCRFLFSSLRAISKSSWYRGFSSSSRSLGSSSKAFQGHLGIFGHQLGDHVGFVYRYVQGPGHVLEHRLGLERAEGDDLPHPILAVFLGYVIDDLAPAFEAEVHVKVGHGHALGVQEAFEQQAIAQGSMSVMRRE